MVSHPGVVVVNGLGAIAVVIAARVLGIFGQDARRDLRLAGLNPGKLHRYPLLLPFLVCFAGFLVLGRDGVPGLEGSLGYLFSSALGMLTVGFSEELGSRGLPQGSAMDTDPRLLVTWLALVFGCWHLGNTVFFGQSLDETLWQIVMSTALGFAFGASRLLIGSILPLIALHAFNDWMQLNTPGAAPFWFQVTVVVVELGWGAVLLRMAIRDHDGAVATRPRPIVI